MTVIFVTKIITKKYAFKSKNLSKPEGKMLRKMQLHRSLYTFLILPVTNSSVTLKRNRSH